ncbi:MAG: hypothetical protein RLZZ28_753 [Bacteroidota bacterium]|jgi:hypothetical protein
MKKIIKTGSLFLVAAFILASCKNNVPREAKYIPKEASLVLVLDPQQLQDKLTKGGISIDTLIAHVFKHDSIDLKDKAIFADVKDSAGINWGDKICLFAVQKTHADNSQSSSFSILGGLKDAAKLEAFIKKQDELKGKEIKKEKDYQYLVLSEGSMIAWNNEQVIATMYTHVLKPVYDTVAMQFKKPGPANTEADMKAESARYFTQKPKESMADLTVFTDMFSEKADGYAFSGSNSSLAALSMMPLQLPKMEELLKDNFVTATLNFEEGRIIAKSTSYTNQLLSSVLKQYAGPTVNLSLLENYPSSNINGIMVAAFNPEIFGGLLKQLEVEGLVNNFLEKSKITSQDLYKSLKGDIAVIVSDLGMELNEPQFKRDEKSMRRKNSFGKMILTAPVGNKASFTKLMDKAVETGVITKVNNTYKAAGLLAEMGLFLIADDQQLTIASDSLTYQQYLSKTGKSVINKEVLDRFRGKSTVFYIDIANTVKNFDKDSSGSFHRSMSSARQTFKDILASSDNFDGKSVKAQLEVRMQNEKQNSLVTLTSLITNIAVDMRLRARKERELEDRLFQGSVPAIIRTN